MTANMKPLVDALAALRRGFARGDRRCGHSICSQNYIDTGDGACVAATLDERLATITPEHLGPDADEHDVAAFCATLEAVAERDGIETASPEEWDTLETAVLEGRRRAGRGQSWLADARRARLAAAEGRR